MTNLTAAQKHSVDLAPTHKSENITQQLLDNPNRLIPTPNVSHDSARDDEKRWNPLAVDPIASRFSSYAAFNGKEIVTPLVPDRSVDAELIDAHDQLRHQILGHFFRALARSRHSAKRVIVLVYTQS